MSKMTIKPIVTFGEMMLRLSPPEVQRLTQARRFEAMYVGSEANIAVSLAYYGLPVEYVTRLPENELAEAALAELRSHGVSVRHVLRGGERLGVYFVELGAAQRPMQVIYDRGNSALATIQPGMVDWKELFEAAGWYHCTGITPGLTASAAAVCLEALQAAQAAGVFVSCDLNYRARLWQWGRSAQEVMSELLPYCDLIFCNGESLEKMLGLAAPREPVTPGNQAAAQYQQICRDLAERFPNLKMIAVTQRRYLSANHNLLSGVLWHKGDFYVAPQFEAVPIVDRVGGGDAFASGLIYSLLTEAPPQAALNFAAGAFCLKHTIWGDFNLVRPAEVHRLVQEVTAG
jgi:2-dehydro-3-deoxygluconokinase